MDLWIRSQDKKRLVKVDYVYIEPTYGLEICCGSYHCLNQNIGTYTTNERALEVLDEIEECLINLDKAVIYSMTPVEDYQNVYEMPKE